MANVSEESEQYYYEYYYLEDPKDIVADELYEEACHLFEFSLVFLLVFSVVVLTSVAYFALLVRRRLVYTAVDVFVGLIVACGVIRLSPKVWQALIVRGHYIPPPTQSGCKLAAFTNVGMTHVVAYFVCSLVFLALKMKEKGAPVVDAFARRNIAWILLLLFAFEGVTGMVPAIYTDLSVNDRTCNITQSLSMTPTGYLVGHLALFCFLPIMIPFVVTIYPAIRLYRLVRPSALDDDEQVRSDAKTILVAFGSYVTIYVPMGFVTIIVLTTAWSGVTINWVAACHVEALFRCLEDCWFIFLPCLVVLRDRELSSDMRAKRMLEGLVHKITDMVGINGGGGGTHLDRVRME